MSAESQFLREGMNKQAAPFSCRDRPRRSGCAGTVRLQESGGVFVGQPYGIGRAGNRAFTCFG